MVSCLKREYVGKGRKYHGKNWKGWKKIGDKKNEEKNFLKKQWEVAGKIEAIC